MTSKDNPLTARVFVNRLWKLAFGQGLSTTLQDLGSQGEWPTHPELAGLAGRRVHGERLGREAHGPDAGHVGDLPPDVARLEGAGGARPLQPPLRAAGRFRLDAEAVRDNALAISGLLSPRMGGPSVHPYQPRGYWAYLNFPPREWDDDTKEDQYRRGVYTWWQRTFPQPSLLAFDAPSREECVAERTRSNVPQQALALLNDPTYVEAGRVFAERILREGGTGFEARLRWAYARALAREPSADEIRILSNLYQRHRAEYASGPGRSRGASCRRASRPRPRASTFASWRPGRRWRGRS